MSQGPTHRGIREDVWNIKIISEKRGLFYFSNYIQVQARLHTSKPSVMVHHFTNDHTLETKASIQPNRTRNAAIVSHAVYATAP